MCSFNMLEHALTYPHSDKIRCTTILSSLMLYSGSIQYTACDISSATLVMSYTKQLTVCCHCFVTLQCPVQTLLIWPANHNICNYTGV